MGTVLNLKRYWTCYLALILVAIFFVLRALYAGYTGEENRYASVAWQMYQEHNWIVPRLGYHLYPDKPPLTYWLTIIGWHINAHWQWPLIIPALFTFGCFFLTQKIAGLLFESEHLSKNYIAQYAPLILLGMPYFVLHYGLVRFDMQLTFFNLLAVYSLLMMEVKTSIHYVNQKKSTRFICYLLFVLANTLGVLAKGPVIYLFTVPELFAVAWGYGLFSQRFVWKYFGAILLSLLLCLCWVLPVLFSVGFAYAHHLIIEQIFMRVAGSDHIGGAKPIWHYLPMLVMIFFPWLVFGRFCQVVVRFRNYSSACQAAVIFLLCSIIVPVVILSLVRSKQERYLLPLAPLCAVYITACCYQFGQRLRLPKDHIFSKGGYIAGVLLCFLGLLVFFAVKYDTHLNILYRLYFPRELGLLVAVLSLLYYVVYKFKYNRQPVIIALVNFFIIAILQLGYLFAVAQARNLQPIAIELQQLQANKVPIVSTDSLVSEMQYLGKFTAPIDVLDNHAVQHQWRIAHPEGWVLFTESCSGEVDFRLPAECYQQNYLRLKRVMMLCPVTVLDPACDGESIQNKCFVRK